IRLPSWASSTIATSRTRILIACLIDTVCRAVLSVLSTTTPDTLCPPSAADRSERSVHSLSLGLCRATQGRTCVLALIVRSTKGPKPAPSHDCSKAGVTSAGVDRGEQTFEYI